MMRQTKLKFGSYPYTATRTKAMKSLLLSEEDYLKMRKMGPHEMIRFLAEGEYKMEIDSLSSAYKGMELINMALNKNLANTINKLILISAKEARAIIKNYAMKWVIANIKIIIRTKDLNEAKKAIVPISPTTEEYCYDLIKKDNEELAKEVRIISGIGKEKFKALLDSGDIVSLENEIDKSYYAGMFSVYNRLEEGVLKAFYLLLLELTDIRNIIKLKSIGIAKELIQGLTITKLGARLAAMENSIKALKESRYKALAEGIENEPTMFESNAEKYLLEHSFRLLHLKPLSIAPIFGYLLAKEIEIRNLRLLTNSKALGMADEFVEKNLIV